MKRMLIIILWLSAVNLYSQQNMNLDIYMIRLNIEKGSVISFDNAINISKHPGYDNQPMFSSDGKLIYYTSMTKDSTTDIQIYDIENKKKIKTVASPLTSEYSPTPIPGTHKIAFVRLEEDGKTQRIWQQELPKGKPELLLDKVDSVGYFWFIGNGQLAAFILSENESAHELRLIDLKTQAEKTLDDSIGRCIRLSDDSSAIVYVKKNKDQNIIKRYNFYNGSITEYFETPEGSEDFVFYNNVKIWMAQDNKLFEYWMAAKFPHWDEKDAFQNNNSNLKNITRMSLSPDKSYLVIVANE